MSSSLGLRAVGLLAAVVVLSAVPSAGAAEAPRVAIEGAAGPGPASYDRVWVRKYGPRRPSSVMVLIPGSPSGEANYREIAPYLTRKVRGLAVWALDRRPNAFEDVFGFELDDPDAALGYYSGFGPVDGASFEPVPDSAAPFVRKWGAALAFKDLHRVVRRARDHGRRKVILGGHSFGGLTIPAYAAWDFHGRAGYRDLAGMVQIDGTLFGGFDDAFRGTEYAHPLQTVTQAKARLAALADQSPFEDDFLPGGLPTWILGVATEVACQYAEDAPDEPSALQQLAQLAPGGLIPPGLVPPVPVTNEAFIGYLLENAAYFTRVRAGRIADTGDPRPWIDSKYSSVQRACAGFTQEPGNGIEWYFPERLSIDLIRAMQYVRRTPVTDYLGLRPWHLREIDTPLYFFETGLSKGQGAKGTRRFFHSSSIPSATIVSDPRMGHLDPLLDVPRHNRFAKTVVPFLREVTAGRRR